LSSSGADVVHLNWVGGEMLSVEDIGRITQPVVWTLHDMWPFCGAEHYSQDSRWREGYTSSNRSPEEHGVDLNRWVWRRKRRSWRTMHLVAPSRWLADCVKESALMRTWPETVIPYALDLDIWRPMERGMAREILGLPQRGRLLLFGALGGGQDSRKGMDLLLEALRHLRGKLEDLQLVIFGERRPREAPVLPFPIHYMGSLHDDVSLRTLYCAADAMAVPSRQDNLPQTAIEAQACGTPVVAFDTGGLSDAVTHHRTGWLARAFETEDLARGISWVMADESRRADLGRSARAQAEQRYAMPVVARAYREVYASVLGTR
jgi:glycosyltransferase involved in cell wall biosynthesis